METENTNTASDTQTAEHPSSSQGKVKKKTLLLGVIAALVLAGVLFYFFYSGESQPASVSSGQWREDYGRGVQ